MQSRYEDGAKTPYKDFIETAYTAALRYGVRAPRIPGPGQYSPAWEVPEELAVPQISRTLKQIHHLKDLGQNLGVSCYKYFESVRPDVMIDWEASESGNIRLLAHGTQDVIRERASIQKQDVDDLRSFRRAIYESIMVTAMEMARLLYGGSYEDSYRYSRESTVNLVRGARWDVFPFARTGSATKSGSSQTSQLPEKHKEPKMVMICVPPWDLSEPDLQDFATQRTLATGELDLTPGEMRISKTHILWTIVYEACKRARCSYFILTTYDYWVFGNMSKNYTTASVSPVFDFSERSGMYQRPNLLQLVTYWELSSIGETSWDTSLDEDIANQG